MLMYIFVHYNHTPGPQYSFLRFKCYGGNQNRITSKGIFSQNSFYYQKLQCFWPRKCLWSCFVECLPFYMALLLDWSVNKILTLELLLIWTWTLTYLEITCGYHSNCCGALCFWCGVRFPHRNAPCQRRIVVLLKGSGHYWYYSK